MRFVDSAILIGILYASFITELLKLLIVLLYFLFRLLAGNTTMHFVFLDEIVAALFSDVGIDDWP